MDNTKSITMTPGKIYLFGTFFAITLLLHGPFSKRKHGNDSTSYRQNGTVNMAIAYHVYRHKTGDVSAVPNEELSVGSKENLKEHLDKTSGEGESELIQKGENIITRVIGKKGHIKDFPYLGAVITKTIHHGSAVILNRNWVLTSASSPLSKKPSDTFIRVASDSAIEKGQTRYASKIIINPERLRWKNDVALIKLKSPLKLGKNVKAIKFSNSTPIKGNKGIIAGYGFANESSTHPNSTGWTRDGWLRVASVEILPYEDCKEYYYNTGYSAYFTNTSFCSTPTTDSVPCLLDNGSPLVIRNKLVGIFSGNPKCGTTKWPPVYTDTNHFRNWIEETIRNNSYTRELKKIHEDILYFKQ